MNPAHLHLLINHFPTVGTVIALGLFLVALISNSVELKRASLVVFFLIALLTIPAYITGNAAEEVLRGRTGVVSSALVEHRNAAQLALLFMEITGLVAWVALWRFRRSATFGNTSLAAVLVLSSLTLGIVGYAANLGGGIRHPEIADTATPGQPAAAPPAPVAATVAKELSPGSLGDYVTDHAWVWPACETLHFIGLTLLMGVVLLVNLRMLGVIKGVSFAALHRLLPWAVLGFVVNLLTGMLFFAGRASQYTTNPVFHWKIALLVLAGANALYFTIFNQTWALESGDNAPLMAKAMAGTAMFLWVAILFCGSMLPFLGGSF